MGEKTLIIAGANEFLGPEGSEQQTAVHLAPKFLKAYELMGYTRVFPTQREADWLLEHSGEEFLPELFRPVEDEPIVEYYTYDGHTVGLMMFPMLPPEMQEAPPYLLDAVINAGREARGQVDLLVGVSSWGKWGEERFLLHEDLPFDIILGGGAGPGSRCHPMDSGTLIWTRTFYKGRSLHVVQLLSWPEGSGNDNMVLDENISCTIIPLYEEIPSFPPVSDLFPQ
mgnify:FL=1